jgi:hypothetical protein
MEALGEEVGAGKGKRVRTAIMLASVKAHVVMKPKAFCARVRALCIVSGAMPDCGVCVLAVESEWRSGSATQMVAYLQNSSMRLSRSASEGVLFTFE